RCRAEPPRAGWSEGRSGASDGPRGGAVGGGSEASQRWSADRCRDARGEPGEGFRLGGGGDGVEVPAAVPRHPAVVVPPPAPGSVTTPTEAGIEGSPGPAGAPSSTSGSDRPGR